MALRRSKRSVCFFAIAVSVLLYLINSPILINDHHNMEERNKMKSFARLEVDHTSKKELPYMFNDNSKPFQGKNY